MPRRERNSPSTAHIGVGFLAQLSSASATAFQFLISAFSPFYSLAAIFSAARRYLSRSDRLQLMDQFNRILFSAILTLQSFLQLKYQPINDHTQSLFATHPAAMCVAVASSLVYFLAYAAVLRFPLHRFASLAHHVLLYSGCIAVASLAAVMLPDTVRPFVYAVFGLIAAAVLLYFLYRKVVEEEDEAELSQFLKGNFSGLMRRLPV